MKFQIQTIIILILLSFKPHANACDIDRRIPTCIEKRCIPEVQKAFLNYISSETACGVSDKSIPFIKFAMTGKQKRGSVVLVHGLTAGPGHMKILAQKLSDEGYDVVVPILKGHGGNDDLLMTASIDEWKKDVDFAARIASKLGQPVSILGHSTGGMLAALDASEHPGRYKSIIGLDPVLNLAGALGTSMKYACLAKHIWNYPDEILAGHFSPSEMWNGVCSHNILKRDPGVIAFELNHHIENILSKTCGDFRSPLPHFNYEWPLQALCSLKQGADQITPEKIKDLPPIHLELTRDHSIFDYENRDLLIEQVAKNPHHSINDLETNEIEPNAFHGLMLVPCAQHYKPMERRIVSLIEKNDQN